MELFLILLIISIVMGIIGAIRWAVSKKRGTKYEDLKPLEHPFFGAGAKAVREGGLRWVAEQFVKGSNWYLTILTEKESFYPEYKLSDLPTWEDLIVAKNNLIEQINNLKEGERWEDIEPLLSVMKDKPTKFMGKIKGRAYYEIQNKSGVWKLRILKGGFVGSKVIASAVANTWQEIIQERDLLLEQEGLQMYMEAEPIPLKKSKPKKLKKLKKLEREK